MSGHVYLKLKDANLSALPDLPVPVRQERLAEVMRAGEIHPDALLDELDVFLMEHPEYQRKYAELAARLSYITGMQMASMGLFESAVHYLEIGSKWSPESWSVRLNHAVALHLIGNYREALDEYLHALADPDVAVTPLVTVLAARCCHEMGRWKLGADLLKTLTAFTPHEPDFWDFLAEMEAKATGISDPRPTATMDSLSEITKDRSAGLPHAQDLFCTQCGTRASRDARYCHECGHPLRNPV